MKFNKIIFHISSSEIILPKNRRVNLVLNFNKKNIIGNVSNLECIFITKNKYIVSGDINITSLKLSKNIVEELFPSIYLDKDQKLKLTSLIFYSHPDIEIQSIKKQINKRNVN